MVLGYPLSSSDLRTEAQTGRVNPSGGSGDAKLIKLSENTVVTINAFT